MALWMIENLRKALPEAQVLEREEINKWIPQRTIASYKYTNGTLLSLVGSHKYPGAGILALQAAARVGAGLIQALVLECMWGLLPVVLPEVIPTVVPCVPETLDELITKADALLVGCGLGQEKSAQELARNLMIASIPTVLDGDGFSILKSLPEETYAQMSQGKWLLTPHGGELRRLIPNLPNDGFDFLKVVREKAVAWQCAFLIKGFPGVIVSHQGEIWICPPGDPAATTAGCGDVLAGSCAGYLAQGVLPAQAAALGSLVVARATHAVVRENGIHTVLASDLVARLGHVLR